MTPNSRASDERILDWLALKPKGYEWQQIGKMFGVAGSSVNRTCNRVKREDMVSGDNPAEIEMGYW